MVHDAGGGGCYTGSAVGMVSGVVSSLHFELALERCKVEKMTFKRFELGMQKRASEIRNSPRDVEISDLESQSKGTMEIEMRTGKRVNS